MKKLLLIFTVVVIVACKDKKETENKNIESIKTPKTEKISLGYPEIQKFSKQITFLREEIHDFSEDIEIEEIGVVEGEKLETYNFLFYVGDNTNLELLSKYTLALMLYPEDKEVLLSSKDKKRGFIVKSVKCKIMREGKYPVVVFPDYNIGFKKIKMAKAYLYNKDGILNPNKQKLIIKEFSL
ncbi:MAG: hypothetical protein COA88_08205 [Kordia sp.]|nr:MAG: hypothetical protein COA88_08205 [Kordia sp.]